MGRRRDRSRERADDAVMTLSELYRITEGNLEARRAFIQLRPSDTAALSRLTGWIDRHAPAIAQQFYDHQFAFAPTAQFFKAYADANGRPLADVRAALERAQAGYLRQIFAEARDGGRYGVEYFERRLHVGQLHNMINLPLKWYVGSYVTYFDLLRRQLRRSLPHRPRFRARVERALLAVFNLDQQAIVEAFYYDTFATMGVDLRQVSVVDASHDLSDHSADLKAVVFETLTAVSAMTSEVRTATTVMASTADEAGRAVGEIADAVTEVAHGAERQVRSLEKARGLSVEMATATDAGGRSATETTVAADAARGLAADGLEAVGEATSAMAAMRGASEEATSAISRLGAKSSEIGGIVATITGIAEQTNLLALNAAIEAARAGEQGRGFAVVAEEVRKLADESGRAAASITELIGEIQAETRTVVAVVSDGATATSAGTETVERARASFLRLGEAVDGMHARAGEIAGFMRDIAAGSGSLLVAMEDVSAVAEQSSASSQQVSAASQETAASTQELATATEELAGTAETLERLIGRLELGTGA
jgi:methyl-accepting chemotaxis protein